MAKKKKKGCGCSNGVNLKRLAIVGGGAVAAKAANYPIIKAIDYVLPEEKRSTMPDWQKKAVKLAVPGIKIAGGAYAQTSSYEEVRDAGLGVIAVGAIEAVDIIIPAFNLDASLDGTFEDFEHVGNTVEIDLDELSGGGSGFDRRLENYQEVAGNFSDEYLDEEMELAGYDEDYM